MAEGETSTPVKYFGLDVHGLFCRKSSNLVSSNVYLASAPVGVEVLSDGAGLVVVVDEDMDFEQELSFPLLLLLL